MDGVPPFAHAHAQQALEMGTEQGRPLHNTSRCGGKCRSSLAGARSNCYMRRSDGKCR
ncbi:hypothetical protein APY04_0390 [Hyphomicrobium sulfonivorans]|uniref:Uncharacterized protein n=1 Tax=Hyphomicrobium sulfonivorans TaxID=121290 RepID=A0A125NW19_HYPSL|nr:hypothetical protein APY04_0390 [Hyphomicrobium sulfonivorans]